MQDQEHHDSEPSKEAMQHRQPDQQSGLNAEAQHLHGQGGTRQPMFNLPSVIVWLAAVLAGIHLIRSQFLSDDSDFAVLLLFSFIPAAYTEMAALLPYPEARFWSPVTYAFLHGGWEHLFINMLWMVAFGTPVARRFGAMRFFGFSAVCVLAGAALHLAFYIGDMSPVVGASAAVSGYMGAASRFAFGDRPGQGMRHDGQALSLAEAVRNRQFLTFLIVWMAMNFVFGSGIIAGFSDGAQVAWQAHIGGFLAGILLFTLFDPLHR